MTRKARLWTGTTLLILIAFNYIVMTFPLYSRMHSLETRIKVMMIKQVKSGEILKNSEENYIIDVLKRETITLDRRLVIINCVAATIAVMVVSWILYGLIMCKEAGRKR